MKTSIKIFVLFILMNSADALMPATVSAQTSVSFQVFYNDLSPYGNWVNYPDYGYVWIPGYGPDFVPYSSNGYWVYTDFGWTWVSNYSWGWAPFHYGRWSFDPLYGWFWIPDNVWGPAWVTWRTGPDYYGWAPLGPYTTYNVAYNPPPNQWIFVNNYYMGQHDIYHHYRPRKNNVTYINNSSVINNTYISKGNTTFHAGPKREDVEKARGTKLQPVTIKEGSKKEQSLKNDQLTLYKPEITKGDGAKPEKIADLKELKGANDKKTIKVEKKPLVESEEDRSKNKGTIEQPATRQKTIKKENSVVPAPKINPNKKAEPGPRINPEKQKQTPEPKPVQPKMNRNQNFSPQPKNEMKKPDQQPKMNPGRSPGMQPQQNPGKNHGKPR
jgi:hypothetical protein